MQGLISFRPIKKVDLSFLPALTYNENLKMQSHTHTLFKAKQDIETARKQIEHIKSYDRNIVIDAEAYEEGVRAPCCELNGRMKTIATLPMGIFLGFMAGVSIAKSVEASHPVGIVIFVLAELAGITLGALPCIIPTIQIAHLEKQIEHAEKILRDEPTSQEVSVTIEQADEKTALVSFKP
jgi:hypothetical protein